MNAKFCGAIVLAGMLSISYAATAREAVSPYDTIACKDRNVVLGFARVMEKTSVPAYRSYVSGLLATGRCAIVRADRPVAVAQLNSNAGTCLELEPGAACYWTSTAVTLVNPSAPAVVLAPRPSPSDAGTTGSAR